MEYKNIEELYLAVGVAGAIIVVFLSLFVWIIVVNNKKTIDTIENIAKEINSLQMNDGNFEKLMCNLIDAIKELSITNKTVAETVSRLDFYNKDLHRKIDKHDDKADVILQEVRKNGN